MIVTKKALPRRTFLRGAGVTLPKHSLNCSGRMARSRLIDVTGRFGSSRITSGAATAANAASIKAARLTVRRWTSGCKQSVK